MTEQTLTETQPRTDAPAQTKEQVYDSQIAPLVGQIIEICKTNKIAAVVSFNISDDIEQGVVASSLLLGGECPAPEAMVQAALLLMPDDSEPVEPVPADAAADPESPHVLTYPPTELIIAR